MTNLKEKRNVRWGTAVRAVPAVLFLAMLFYFACHNSGILEKSFNKATFTKKSLGKVTKDLEGALRKDFFRKYDFVNLNGLVARGLGINSLNGVQKLANGYLTSFRGNPDGAKGVDAIIALNEYCCTRGIPFLLVICPAKTSFYATRFSPGYENVHPRENMKRILSKLEGRSVNFIDMDKWFEENHWAMEDTFFKTDHHWTSKAGFAAYGEVMKNLNQKYGIVYDSALCDISNWNVKTNESFFLGSHGKRVGAKYTGVDDFDLIMPRAKTDIDFSWLVLNTTSWHYQKTALNYYAIDYKGFFNKDPYMFYMAPDSAVMRVRNSLAVNNKRILVTGDSFSRPITTFLTSQFAQTDRIDLRYYKDGTLLEYINEVHPDVVLVCWYEDSFQNKAHFTFGLEDYKVGVAKTKKDVSVRELGTVSLRASGRDNGRFTELASDLKPNTYYTLTADAVELAGADGAPGEYVQFTLQNLADNKPVFNRYFSTAEEGPHRWIFRTPKDRNGSYSIYVYAGTKGATAKRRARVSGVALQEGVVPAVSAASSASSQ